MRCWDLEYWMSMNNFDFKAKNNFKFEMAWSKLASSVANVFSLLKKLEFGIWQ